MKYDALHNRQFLETMFDPGGKDTENACITATSDSSNSKPSKLPKLRELYQLAKILFEYLWIILL